MNKLTKQDRLENAYNSALYAIATMDTSVAILEDFDQELEGSSITDELTDIIDKAQAKMRKVLDKNFKLMGYSKLK